MRHLILTALILFVTLPAAAQNKNQPKPAVSPEIGPQIPSQIRGQTALRAVYPCSLRINLDLTEKWLETV